MRYLVLSSTILVAVLLILSMGPRGVDARAPLAPAAARPFAPAAITATVQVGPNSTISFSPTTQIVNAGDGVQWEWSSMLIPHSVVSGTCSGFTCTPDGKFTSGLPTTAPNSYDFTFSAPGVYPYYCGEHLSAMQGVIVVVAPRLWLPLLVR